MNSPPESHRAIGAGTILIEQNTTLPGTLALESSSTGSGWTQMTNNPSRHLLEEKLSAAGWTFFLMAGTIKTIGFGFDQPGMIQGALNRLIAAVKLQKCNCLEIDAVTKHSFLGLPYVSLSAHSRHIQGGMVFGHHTDLTK